jgi:hypothetical protein
VRGVKNPKGSFGNRKSRGEPGVFPGLEAHPEAWARAKLPRYLEVHAAGWENPIHAFSSGWRSPTSRLLASHPRPFRVSPPRSTSISFFGTAHPHHSVSSPGQIEQRMGRRRQIEEAPLTNRPPPLSSPSSGRCEADLL